MGLTIINNKKHLSVSLLDKINKGKNNMIAFHGKQEIKDFYLARVRAHREADEIIKGVYWENGKGCAVGCTIHSSNHEDYEEKLGIHRVLARLQDFIFENLPNDKSDDWAEEFLSAINVGADLSGVWQKFSIWLLTDEKYGVIKYAKNASIIDAIQKTAAGYLNYELMNSEYWGIVKRTTAVTFYDSFPDAASTAVSYAVAYTTCTDDYDARKKHIIAQSEKLLELLKECKSKE